MAKLRATPRKPTASTVETVDVLNSAKKDASTSFMRRRSERSAEPLGVEGRQRDVPETPTRTSPRKRKEPPTATAGSSKLRRVTLARVPPVKVTMSRTSIPQPQSSTKSVKAVRRSNVFDPPEANEEEQESAIVRAPALKKQKGLNRKGAKDHFQGHYEIELPASSPAKATRSHDKANKTTTTRREEPREPSETQNRKRPNNILARASKHLAEARSVDRQEAEVSTGRRRGRSSQVPVKGPSKQLPIDAVSATRKSRSEPNKIQPASGNEEPQVSTTETSNESEADPLRSSRKTTNPQLEAEVIAGVEEAASLYDCTNAWTRVLVYAKKAVQPTTSVKPGKLKDVMNVIKSIKVAYNKIYQNEMCKDDLEEVEMDIELRTEQLKDLRLKIAAADPKEHDLTFVEHIHEQIIPRISFMMKTALAARFDEQAKKLSIDTLEELVGLINVTLAFRELAEKAQHKPKGLTNGKGELILGPATSAISSMRFIKTRYSNTIANHKSAAERAEEARRREAEIAREARNAAAIQQQKVQERAEAYNRKLREEREKKAEAARRLVARQAEEEWRWKQDLMTNKSVEADRLRRKFNLPYQPSAAHGIAPGIQNSAADIDDFDMNDDFELVRSRPTEYRPSGVHHTRPQPRREPTEDIPAPVIEPKWTDQQIEALVWGLRNFRGRDRYQDILHSPELEGLLRGKNDFDLMQQALYIKQSMTRAMETGVLPNGTPLEDDWSWLRSV